VTFTDFAVLTAAAWVVVFGLGGRDLLHKLRHERTQRQFNAEVYDEMCELGIDRNAAAQVVVDRWNERARLESMWNTPYRGRVRKAGRR
jgi:hypothetical protein